MTTTWRDEASPQAQADLDELLSAALGAAMEHLEKNGEFYPFAMSVDGEPTVDADGVAAWLGERRGSAISLRVPQRGDKRALA